MDRLAARLARLIFGVPAACWLAPVMARALPSGLVVLAASLAAAALGLAMPRLTRQVIDAGIMAHDMGALVFWAGLSFALGLGAVGFGMVNAMLHLRASTRMLADLRGRLFGAALARDPAKADLTLGEAMARLDGDCAEIQSFAFDTLLVAVGALFRLAGKDPGRHGMMGGARGSGGVQGDGQWLARRLGALVRSCGGDHRTQPVRRHPRAGLGM
ncbi:ABC transporter transmembrane domain-containing protein, partial [Paracoccus yeei]|uniref:ABC transporter transmembrane domain-containing protein n=1 Tax=Paracoccus yeei TaxID=147645 RepID=UPI0037CE0713